MTASGSNRNPQHPHVPSPIMIDHVKAVARLQEDLQSITRLAVDTESNSLFAYQERVCLIQLSTDRRDYLVDPLRLAGRAELTFLGDIFADPRIEKVLHAAEYDVMTLRRDYHFTFTNLFDTMIAARILGMERVGLAPLLEEYFEVRANKKHQRDNWGRRPLSQEMIRYAQNDTHYLLRLRDEMHLRLQQGGHLDEARELFNEVAQAEWGGTEFDPHGFWRLNGVNQLSHREIAILEALYHYREQQARHRDLPVFKIISDDALVQLASAKPQTFEQLADVPQVGNSMVDRYGSDLLRVIEEGQHTQLPKRPHPREQTEEIIQRRFDALHLWRKERALARGVSSEIILSKNALWELAQKVPQTLEALAALPTIGPWRAQTYGNELLAVLATVKDEPAS